MPNQHAPTAQPQVHAMPVQVRGATLEPSTFNDADNTVEVVWTQGAQVRRYDWWNERPYDEALEVTPEAVDMARFEAGTVQVLDGHRTYGGIAAILGIAERGWIEGGEGRATLRLSQRPELAGLVADIKAGVIRAISFGYSVQKFEITRAQDRTDGINVDLYRAVRWTPQEISFVTVPADPGAGTRSQPAGQQGEAKFACEFITNRAVAHNPEDQSMPQQNTAGEGGPVVHTPAVADSTRAAPVAAAHATPAAPATPAAFDGERAASIVELCQRHGMSDLQAKLLREQSTLDQARAAVLDELDKRAASTAGGPTTSIRTTGDAHENRLRGIENALLHRANPVNKLDDNGRQYRGMSMLDMAREMVEGLGHNTRGLSRMELARVALQVRSGGYMGTGDFANLLGGVGQRILRAAYDQAPSTFQLWARRASNLQDFRIRNVIGVTGDTELKKLNEHGEYTYGSLSEDGTGYKAMSYGRSLAITRQMLVNDDLDAFARVGARFADSARRLENRLVYQQILGNPLMQDGKTLFHADHGNLGDGELSLEGLSAGRTLMRKQKNGTGKDAEQLNIAPAYLLVPSDLETKAYQFTSSNYTPTTAGEVNEFRAGGRTSVEPIVEPLLDVDPTAFFLLASAGQVDTVEYAYVDGYEGLRVETFVSEDVDGIKLRATLDFATKATDWRGMVKSKP